MIETETANYNKSVAAKMMVPTIKLAHILPKDWRIMDRGAVWTWALQV